MINEPTIDAMNEAIALFMGQSRMHPSDRRWHKDWNCLMPVWFKIQTIGADMGYVFKKFHEAFHAGIDHQSIEKCHHAVCQFIQWYNKSNTNDATANHD